MSIMPCNCRCCRSRRDKGTDFSAELIAEMKTRMAEASPTPPPASVEAGAVEVAKRAFWEAESGGNTKGYCMQAALTAAFPVLHKQIATLTAERDAAIASLREARGGVVGEWQPIETAPKDGKLFLCWVNAVRYVEHDDGRVEECDASDCDFGVWRDGDYGGYYEAMATPRADREHITHWMPLPPPPAALVQP